MKTPVEYQNFDRAMTKLLAVPRAELKAKLDAEKAEKKRKSKKASEKDKK